MKGMLAFLLLFIPVISLSISSPSQLSVTGNTTIDISIFEAPVGSRLTISWSNDRLDIFPGIIYIGQQSMIPTIHVIPSLGVCGKTNVTFTVASTQSVTELDFGQCTVLPGEYNPDNSYLGKKMWDLRDEISRLKYYFLMTPEIQAYIDDITQQIAGANAIDITVSQAEFTRKDIMTHQIELQINQLDLAFRGINKDLSIPSIVVLKDTLSDLGNTYLVGKVEEKLGKVERFNDALYYKREARTILTKAGNSTPFTLYTIKFYNPASTEQSFFFAEDIVVDVADPTPYTNQSITVWNINLKPYELKIVKYAVYRDPDEAITSMAFRLKPPEPTCSDKIRNQNETDVDCGGPCPPCPELEPVATCFDKLWNQGELGIDCGGPCEKKCTTQIEPVKQPLTGPQENATKPGLLESITQWFSNILKPSNRTKEVTANVTNETNFYENYLELIKIIFRPSSP